MSVEGASPRQNDVRIEHWFKVPEFLGTRACGRQVREDAEATSARVLDFSATEFLSLTAADELVCNGSWDATTGESPEIRQQVERALKRRGMLPCGTDDEHLYSDEQVRAMWWALRELSKWPGPASDFACAAMQSFPAPQEWRTSRPSLDRRWEGPYGDA